MLLTLCSSYTYCIMYTLIVVVGSSTNNNLNCFICSIYSRARLYCTYIKICIFCWKKKQTKSEWTRRERQKVKESKKKLFKLLDAKIFQWFHFRIEKGYRDSIWRMVFSFYFILDVYLKYTYTYTIRIQRYASL